MAATLIELMCATAPAHSVYVEPCAGSFAVGFAKPPVTHEVLNDADGRLINFFRVLRDPASNRRLVDALRLTPFSRAEFDAAAGAPHEDPVEDARLFFVRLTMGIAKQATANTGMSTSTNRSQSTVGTYVGTVDRLPEIAARFHRRFLIENRPAVDVVERYGHDPRAVLYIDPPYVWQTRKTCNTYRHEMSDDDHRDLGEAVKAARAAVFVSGYPSPLYADIYDGWATVEYAARCDMTNSPDQRTAARTEMVWTNRDPITPVTQSALF